MAQNGRTSDTQNHSLDMAKHCGDLVAARALHIHGVGVWALNETLQLAFPLLILLGGVQQIFCERHLCALKLKWGVFLKRQEGVILYEVFNNEIGRQFGIYCFGVSPFRIQAMTPCLWVTESCSSWKPVFTERTKTVPIWGKKKTWKILLWSHQVLDLYYCPCVAEQLLLQRIVSVPRTKHYLLQRALACWEPLYKIHISPTIIVFYKISPLLQVFFSAHHPPFLRRC